MGAEADACSASVYVSVFAPPLGKESAEQLIQVVKRTSRIEGLLFRRLESRGFELGQCLVTKLLFGSRKS